MMKCAALFLFVYGQLVLEQTKQEYNFQPTSYGFIPYGHIIKGDMYFVQDLCQSPEFTQKIIITSVSQQCSMQYQIWNANKALAIVFAHETLNEQSLFMDRYSELATVLTMNNSDISQLKLSANSKIRLKFPIQIKLQKPLIEYIIYSITQETEVLRLVEEFKNKGFNFDFNIIYFTTHSSKVENQCQAQNYITSIHLESSIEIYGGKINCRSQFEKTYLIMGNFDKKMTRTQILQYNIQQICVLKQYGVEKWSQYRSQFTNTCLQNKGTQINGCAIKLRQQLIIDELKLSQCYTDSFSKDLSNNSILEEQDKLSTYLSTNHYLEKVTLTVNGQQIYGNYSFDISRLFDATQSGLFLAICQSYIESYKPSLCLNETNSLIEGQNCNCSNTSNQAFTLIAIASLTFFMGLIPYLIKNPPIYCQKLIFSLFICLQKLLSKFRHQDCSQLQQQQENQQEMAQQQIESELILQNDQQSDVNILFDRKNAQNDQNQQIVILDRYVELGEPQ